MRTRIKICGITRTGDALVETVELVRNLGAKVIGCGVIVRFKGSPDHIETPEGDDPIPVLSLAEFDAKWYDTADACSECKQDVPAENVRF